jgi:UDP-N-acetylglucosamine transferase subunit ALG13
MGIYQKLNGNIQDKVDIENAQAQIAKQQAEIDYVAMMADVDILDDEAEGGKADE